MGISSNQLKMVMRKWSSGVAIVTSHLEGKNHGMTVNSFTSVSIDPALIVVTLENNARTCKMIKQTYEFGITILADNQSEISDRFAGKIGETSDRFSGLQTFNLCSSIPYLSDGLAWLECTVVNEINLGHSTLFIAEVLASQLNSGEPLLYHDRSYYRLGEKNG